MVKQIKKYSIPGMIDLLLSNGIKPNVMIINGDFEVTALNVVYNLHPLQTRNLSLEDALLEMIDMIKNLSLVSVKQPIKRLPKKIGNLIIH